jgi:hypothetical protein
MAMSGMLVEFTLEELAKESALILEGHVTTPALKSEVVTLGDTNFRLAFTDNRIRIDNVLKSPREGVPTEVLVRTLGGRTPELEVSVDNEARLSRREDVILFLTREFPVALPPNVFAVMGGFQGKFSVRGSAQARYAVRMGADTEAELELENLRRTIRQYAGIPVFAASH